jgi:hypothetical protein
MVAVQSANSWVDIFFPHLLTLYLILYIYHIRIKLKKITIKKRDRKKTMVTI